MKKASGGARSRNSGKRFEKEVARELRRLFPAYAHQIRRALQAHKAWESDVTGVPGLWVECQFAKRPTPLAKLRQAYRDAKAAFDRANMPVVIVVFRQKGQPRHLPRFRVFRTGIEVEGGLDAFSSGFAPKKGGACTSST